MESGIPGLPPPPAAREAHFYLWDHLGTPRVVMDSAGAVVDFHDYTPFGVEITPHQNLAGVTHQFTGHEHDLATGYDYLHFRYYGGNLGRFMRADDGGDQHLDTPQSWNLYTYVMNRVTIAFDADGRNIRYYFYDTAQSHSGSGHVAIAIQSGNSWIWYESSPAKSGPVEPMNPIGFETSDGGKIVGDNPDELAGQSINGSEFGDATAVVELTTTPDQDKAAVEAADRFFATNLEYDIRKSNCADLGYTVSAAAGEKLSKSSPWATPQGLKASMDKRAKDERNAKQAPRFKTIKGGTLQRSSAGILSRKLFDFRLQYSFWGAP